MAQLSEKLPSILKTTREQRRFVPESEVERLLDEASKRIKAESNELLAQQAASAHLLKYKAKKGRRLAAHLRIHNDRLKQAVEDEQQKFKQLKEALRRRTEQYDKLRLTHLDMEEKVKRLEAKIKRQAANPSITTTTLADGQALQPPMLLMPPPGHSLAVADNTGRAMAAATNGAPAPTGGLQKRAKTPLGTTRPNAQRASYKFRPSSAPGAKPHEDEPQHFPQDMLHSEKGQHWHPPPSVVEVSETDDDVLHSGTEDDLPPASVGTTRFVDQHPLDSSGQEFTDEDRQTEDEEDQSPAVDDQKQQEAYDHFPDPSDDMHDRSMLPPVDERFADDTRYMGNHERPASSPLRRSGGIPPLHGGHRGATKPTQESDRQMSALNDGEMGVDANNREHREHREHRSGGGNRHDRRNDPRGRPSTAPELSGGFSNNNSFQPEEGGHQQQQHYHSDLSPVQDDAEAENTYIDQFLDEGDRLRPNSAPASPSKKPSKRKTMFPKRQPKKRDNAKAAVEEARKLKEEKEAEEHMRMNALKKTWLRAIEEEPLDGGLDKYAYKKKRKWLLVTVCQGVNCQNSAIRRHGCFGLNVIGATVFGFLRSFGANQAAGYYAAAAEFCVMVLGLMSYFGLYNILCANDTLQRLMTYAFSQKRRRPAQNAANLQWKRYVFYLQIMCGLLMLGYSMLTVLGSQLEGLTLFMYILGTPALVWFTVLTTHLLGLFWFTQSQTICFIKDNNPMNKKKDPDVENFFRIRRVVETMSDTFGPYFVVPHATVSLIGLSSCVVGLSAARSNAVTFELLALGIFFSCLFISLLSTGGRITAATDVMFQSRTMHHMEMLKGFQGRFKMALLQLSGASTNDILFDVSNRMVEFHSMMFSLFATSGDDTMAPAITFKAAGVSLRPIHGLVAFVLCTSALVVAAGAGMNAAMDTTPTAGF